MKYGKLFFFTVLQHEPSRVPPALFVFPYDEGAGLVPYNEITTGFRTN